MSLSLAIALTLSAAALSGAAVLGIRLVVRRSIRDEALRLFLVLLVFFFLAGRWILSTF
jgi:succinate dehydrogenase hydrophobic anchor subunit